MKSKDPDKPSGWDEDLWDSPPLMERSHIKNDTYLHCWCPHCGTGLNENDRVVFEIVNNQGAIGVSKLSPYINVLEQESSIHVENDKDLSDVRCPHCHVSLIEQGHRCKEDGCKLVAIHISVSNSKKLRLVGCVRRSCRWYEMSDEDNESLILRDSHEW